MFDRLLDLLQACFTALLPFVILQPYEQGVLCRLGKFQRVLGPGFHWCYPFHIDRVWEDHVTPRTEHLQSLSTTTKDGKAICFDVVVTYRISDIEKAVLEVTHVTDSIADTCMGIIGTALSESTWEEILHGTVTDSLTKLCRSRGWKWGIEIMSVQLAGVAQTRNIRLAGQTQHLAMQHQ